MQKSVEPFDWERILIDQFPLLYMGEVAFRTLFMFVLLLVALKISGKRQIKQLSVFELVLVIGLGSAAGDPMFYDDVPLGSAVVVFIVMMSCYKLITRLSDKSLTVHESLEGKPVYVVENGRILINNFTEEDLSQSELFTTLRLGGIEQLGQVRVAIREPTGEISIFQFEPDAALPGLSIMPNDLQQATDKIDEADLYACANCGLSQSLTPSREPHCSNCGQHKWLKTTT